MTGQSRPVSPIEMTPPRPQYASSSPAPVATPVPAPVRPVNTPRSQAKADWIPFTLKWFYLLVPILISLCLGAIVVALTITSKRNYGLGPDDGSSGILFGWRFTPTLIAVLYAQMTVILFEDVKRTEPFARLAGASSGGVSAYGTILQTPRAWWSIFYDLCFKRHRIGKTSWTLICAALVNVVALLAISPLSSALLTSEEVWAPKSIAFTRMVPKQNAKIPMIPTRETYFRTVTALSRNLSSSAWLNDKNISLPFWPSQEKAQYGTNFDSAYGTWKANTDIITSSLACQEMTLESADISVKRYIAWTWQGYGPINGTTSMVTFVLTSKDGCRYELTVHPAVDIASAGGVTWSNASTYLPAGDNGPLPLAGRLFTTNLTATSNYLRLNTSGTCGDRDIILMSTPYTADLDPKIAAPFIPANYTFQRRSDFKMRGLICDAQYKVQKKDMAVTLVGGSHSVLNSSSPDVAGTPGTELIDIKNFQAVSLRDEWRKFFDKSITEGKTLQSGQGKTRGSNESQLQTKTTYSGMAPLLGVKYNFNLSAMMIDPNLGKTAEAIKGRFFSETLKETFGKAGVYDTEDAIGEATIVEERVVVLTEVGITLAVLFFSSFVLLIVLFWSSRLSRRKLNLRSDPASTIGLALLLNNRLGRSSTLCSMHDASRVDLYTSLQREKYLTTDDALLRGDPDLATPVKVKPKSSWKPRVIQVRLLLLLGLFLTLVLVAVLILNVFSIRSQLSQAAFIYEADISKFGLTLSTFAPISIAPTVISIIVGLWWDQLDSSFRILQPFISMSQRPTPISKGAGLTYRSKTWVGAAIKAGRNRHWVLLMIALGSVLAQVLTVSMSALFERQSFNTVKQVTMPQDFEIRQVPIITEVAAGTKRDTTEHAEKVLEGLYIDPSRNWLYGASIQYAFGGTPLPWTLGNWNFLPPQTSNIRDNLTEKSSSNLGPVNMTMEVPAIRARLSCKRIDEVANTSSWMQLIDMSNSTESELNEVDWAAMNATGSMDLWTFGNDMFNNTNSHTFVRGSAGRIKCCVNGTISRPQRSFMGYWSPVIGPGFTSYVDSYPYNSYGWPMSIVTKWWIGKPVIVRSANNDQDLYFREVPKLQIARCEPVIETATARIVVNEATGEVHDSKIIDTTGAGKTPWLDVFTRHMSQKGEAYEGDKVNVTASFGILFLDSLLGSASRGSEDASNRQISENLQDNAFVIRDAENGWNMDLMSYSMYTLAQRDPEALLNYTTLVAHADTTFSTFFQHFVNSGYRPESGGYVYQPINDQSMESLGKPMDINGTLIEQDLQFPTLNSSRTVTASVTYRTRVLHMNSIATYLSTAILIWLIVTALIVICLQRRYTNFMNRDVQLIADMLVLVAGSDNLLELIAEQGVSLKRSNDINTMLGWFKDRRGQVRWGVEVVGGRNAVEWVDAPKQGFHIPVDSGKKSWMFWKKN